MNIINERIKEMRIKCGLTLLEVAETLNVREATAQRYESGKIKDIKHDTIVKLAELFHCSPSYLMGWSDDVHTQKSKPIDSSLQELYDMIAQLDYEDRAEIKGEVKQMLKADKYRQNEESKNA